jgi:hypothetical protein
MMLADTGEVLLDSLVRSVRHTAWPRAQGINGIARENVAGAPTPEALRPRIADAVAGGPSGGL